MCASILRCVVWFVWVREREKGRERVCVYACVSDAKCDVSGCMVPCVCDVWSHVCVPYGPMCVCRMVPCVCVYACVSDGQCRVGQEERVRQFSAVWSHVCV